MADFFEKIRARRVADRYSLIRKLGQGGFGAVYLGQESNDGHEVALKLEHRDLEPSVLKEENETYSSFQNLVGFPKIYWYGWQDDYKVLVLELLGPNLEDLLVFCGGTFSLKTTLMIIDQLLERFETLHLKGFLHRDVKPQNFLLGTGDKGNVIYMTDFGLAQEYQLDSIFQGSQDSPRRRSGHLVGTARFASLQGHGGDFQSPLDDLESLGYMMIYFLKGRLPWQGMKARSSGDRNNLILERKALQDISELCSGLPKEFTDFVKFTRTRQGDAVVNYSALQKPFRALAKRESIEYDNVFDWSIRMYLRNLG